MISAGRAADHLTANTRGYKYHMSTQMPIA